MKTKLFYKCAADADLIAPTEKDEDDFFCLLANVFAPFFFFFEMKMILLYVRLYVLLIIHFALANAICKADLISFKKKKRRFNENPIMEEEKNLLFATHIRT